MEQTSMNTIPMLIEGTNLSVAWYDILNRIIQNPGYEITPLVLSLSDFTESEAIRNTLEESLISNNKASINTVAETIFPNSLYQLYNYDRETLYNEYLKILPKIKKIDPKNARGTYFERLIAFQGNINQIEIIISSYKNDTSVRRSRLQASIFDATKDHINSPYQGFPCLQHVTFYTTPNGGLIINSFYAIQYLYERAYGNWLGLINLGKFVARELELELERFNCYVGVERLDITKEQAGNLLAIKN